MVRSQKGRTIIAVYGAYLHADTHEMRVAIISMQPTCNHIGPQILRGRTTSRQFKSFLVHANAMAGTSSFGPKPSARL
jgi:hypothetical protein